MYAEHVVILPAGFAFPVRVKEIAKSFFISAFCLPACPSWNN
jgi:hypothetical protein